MDVSRRDARVQLLNLMNVALLLQYRLLKHQMSHFTCLLHNQICRARSQGGIVFWAVGFQILPPNHIRLEGKTLNSVQILPSNQVTVQR